MKRILSSLIILILLTYCSFEGRNTYKESNNLVEVDFTNLPIYKFDTTLIESIRYISLETNEKSIIGDIGKILYSNEVFYIYDNKNQSIFLFDKSGNYIKNVGNLGRGPGEYISINAFDVDSNGNIYVWDGMSNKLIIYSKYDRKYSEYRLNKGFEEFIAAADGHLIVRNLVHQGTIKSRIASYDYINDESVELLDTRYYYDDFDIIRFGRFSLFKSKNRTFFNARFKNEVFEISSNKDINKIIKINDPIKSRAVINQLKDSNNDYLQYQSIVHIGDIYENSKIITMTIQRDLSHTLLISKASGNYILFQNYIRASNYFGSWPIRGVAEEEFIAVFLPLQRDNLLWSKAVERSALEYHEKQILLNRTTNDNPVLILFEYRDF